MGKKSYIFVILLMFLICGCEKKDSSDVEIIRWAVPDMVQIKNGTIEKINVMLQEDGKAFRLEPVVLDFFNYNKELETAEYDIAFAGFAEDGTTYEVLPAIAQGRFYQLDEWLQESEIYATVPEILWKSVTYNGGIYSVPSAAISEMTPTVLIKTDCVGALSETSLMSLEELDSLMSEEGKFLYDYQSGLEFLGYCGWDYQEGLLWEHDGTYYNPMEIEECEEWLRTLNQWYREGKLTTNREDEWTVCMTNTPGDFYNMDTVVYEASKAYTLLHFAGSVAIAADSDRKETAWELLQLLYLDEEYGNILVFGPEHEEKDGYAVNKQGEVLNGRLNKLSWGVGVNLLKGNDEMSLHDSLEEKKAYYESKVELSGIAGQKKPEVSAQMLELEEKYEDIMFADNFEELFLQWKTEAESLFE
ncbi:MAG: hypothetical protein IKB07_02485 [Lachnospiraceae bacterium]|nr:hypothetical protein [Lachnospiraceae bacterium]